MDVWKEYLSYLDEGPYSVRVVSPILAPQVPPLQREAVIVSELGYTLWPFQKKILSEIGDSTLILGLPTGLGKTYLETRNSQRPSP